MKTHLVLKDALAKHVKLFLAYLLGDGEVLKHVVIVVATKHEDANHQFCKILASWFAP